MINTIDLLNRTEFIENVLKLINQLSELKKGCCFAIEGGWGIGKTFVIEKIEKQLKIMQSEESNSDRYYVFNYNCWKYDYYNEPSVAIISAMIASIQKDNLMISAEFDETAKAGYKFVKEKLKKITGMYLENRIGVNLIDWISDINKMKNENEDKLFEFDKMFNFSQTIEKVREELQEIARCRTIILIVDELDRCVPQYAIKVLERLHHIFYGLDNVIVLMSIDRKQLGHSIEDMFGMKKDDESIDIERYLKKFIDFSLVLDNGIINSSFMEKYKFFLEKFSFDDKSNDLEIFYTLLPKLFKDIDIRRQEKMLEKANIIHSMFSDEKADISVFVFEVFYEILKEWRVDSMKRVVTINDAHYPNLEKELGKERIDLLKEIEAESWQGVISYMGDRMGKKKLIKKNLYGKVIWYFANLFSKENILYTIEADSEEREQMELNLKLVQNYWELSQIIM